MLVRPSKASSSAERGRTRREREEREVAAAEEVGTTISSSHYSTYLQTHVMLAAQTAAASLAPG